MVALIAVVIIGAVTPLGGNLKTLFSNIAGKICSRILRSGADAAGLPRPRPFPSTRGASHTLTRLIGRRLDQVRNRDEHGATAVEYGLMVAMIAIVIFGAVTLFGMAVT